MGRHHSQDILRKGTPAVGRQPRQLVSGFALRPHQMQNPHDGFLGAARVRGVVPIDPRRTGVSV